MPSGAPSAERQPPKGSPYRHLRRPGHGRLRELRASSARSVFPSEPPRSTRIPDRQERPPAGSSAALGDLGGETPASGPSGRPWSESDRRVRSLQSRRSSGDRRFPNIRSRRSSDDLSIPRLRSRRSSGDRRSENLPSRRSSDNRRFRTFRAVGRRMTDASQTFRAIGRRMTDASRASDRVGRRVSSSGCSPPPSSTATSPESATTGRGSPPSPPSTGSCSATSGRSRSRTSTSCSAGQSSSLLDAVVAKLVDGGRGGYCFEQNFLLLEVLRSLGFDATPIRPGSGCSARGTSCRRGPTWWCGSGCRTGTGSRTWGSAGCPRRPRCRW